MLEQLKEEARHFATKLITTIITTKDNELKHLDELNDLIDKVYIQGQKDILEKVYFRYNHEKTYKEVIEQCNILNNPLNKNY